LYLPYLQRSAGDQANDLPPSSYLLHDQRSQRKSKPSALQPFRYLLFNSSVEARKNLLFLVKAFAQSGLGREGIRLCVTGKLKSDAYSKAVREVVAHEPAILLSGYVDEATKLDLYLNALALLSPSLVEGFGIPVLDAACLGLPALASSCDAHREIHDLFDFRDYVLPISILETRDWANAMQATASLHNHLMDSPEQERMQRLRRYLRMSRQIEDRFEDQIAQLMLS
jgi:glycosyltransferase involved in cell wall biosynthesis